MVDYIVSMSKDHCIKMMSIIKVDSIYQMYEALSTCLLSLKKKLFLIDKFLDCKQMFVYI